MKKLLKGAAWLAAPKLMFAARSPTKAAMIKAVDWATDLAGTKRRRTSRFGTAAKGLGAAALALPLGLWAGKRFFGADETPPQYSTGRTESYDEKD